MDFHWIAERELTFESDRQKALIVRLGAPIAGEVDYFCPIQITGEGVLVNRGIHGVDSFQAIQLAFVAIAAHVEALEKELRTRLLCEGRNDAGFNLS